MCTTIAHAHRAALSRSKIAMYFGDHAPPHFHVLANDGREAQYVIETLALLAGEVAARDAEEALAWAKVNRQKLFDLWQQYSEAA